jgi:hypothetical protein
MCCFLPGFVAFDEILGVFFRGIDMMTFNLDRLRSVGWVADARTPLFPDGLAHQAEE